MTKFKKPVESGVALAIMASSLRARSAGLMIGNRSLAAFYAPATQNPVTIA